MEIEQTLALALVLVAGLNIAIAIAFFRLRRRHRCCRHAYASAAMERDELKRRLAA